MCQLLVGLPTATVLGVVDEGADTPLMVHIETVLEQSERCAGCGGRARVKDRDRVTLSDLPAFGRCVRLVWRKRRWWCAERGCDIGSWTELAPAIAGARLGLSDRAGRWVTVQVGRSSKPSVARERRSCLRWRDELQAAVAASIVRGRPAQSSTPRNEPGNDSLESDQRRQVIAQAFALERSRTPPAQQDAWCAARQDPRQLAEMLRRGADSAAVQGDATRSEMTAAVQAILARECNRLRSLNVSRQLMDQSGARFRVTSRCEYESRCPSRARRW